MIELCTIDPDATRNPVLQMNSSLCIQIRMHIYQHICCVHEILLAIAGYQKRGKPSDAAILVKLDWWVWGEFSDADGMDICRQGLLP
jgi:hypothetical protein